MRHSVRLALVLAPAVLCALAATTLAQAPSSARRLTFDGRSTPLSWDASGILVARPGALLPEGVQARIASELWLVDPVVASQQLLASDSQLRGRASVSASRAGRVYVVDDNTLSPELWLAAPAGTAPRLILKGANEYFSAPELAPDGRRFVFVRTPSGSETDDTSTVWQGDLLGATLRVLIREAHLPAWSPDGSQLVFQHDGDVYIVDSTVGIATWSAVTPLILGQPSMVDQQQTLSPPTTIRVIHTQGNANFSQSATCRPVTLTVGTIMTIPFESYVSYVLPIEASPSNPTEHLKAQAVAARTYAWKRINPANASDVSDWTDTQAMCDLRADPRTNAATTATAGQYAAYNGGLITAMYSAENSDPTKTNATEFANPGSYPYLRAVNDPISFRITRSGHGQGLSQGGSQRWTRSYGWDYIQILTHYYSGIVIEGQSPLGSLILPWNRWWQGSSHLRIEGRASSGGTFNVVASGSGLTATAVANNTLLTSLDIGVLPDQPIGGLIISGTIGSTQATTLTLGIDRTPPTGTLTLPDFTTSPTVSVGLAGIDSGPSGFAGYSLSDHWLWEGEDKAAQGYVLGAGTVTNDPEALNGQALFAANSTSGVWYGPYATSIPLGHAYRAYFRLKTDNNTTVNEVAKIDVIADQVNPIGMRHLFGTDFHTAGVYQEFSVDFNYVISPSQGLEMRVDFPGATGLWLDRILVATYPVTTPLTSWKLTGPTSNNVIAKFNDNAQNVARDVRTGAPAFTRGWLTTTTPLLAVTTQDAVSGLDLAGGRYRLSVDSGSHWGSWLDAILSGNSGSQAIETLSATPMLSDSVAYQVQFMAASVAGITATSLIYPFKLDASPPTVAITSPVFVSSTAFIVNWSGYDVGSGLAIYDVQSRDTLDGLWTDWLTGTISTSLTYYGIDSRTYQFRVRAADHLGHWSAFSDAGNATTRVGLNLSEHLYLPLVTK